MKDTENKIVYCTPPIMTNLYEFAYKHSSCNFAVKDYDIANESSDVEVLAYVTNPENNNLLDEAFENKSNYRIIANMDFSDPIN